MSSGIIFLVFNNGKRGSCHHILNITNAFKNNSSTCMNWEVVVSKVRCKYI